VGARRWDRRWWAVVSRDVFHEADPLAQTGAAIAARALLYPAAVSEADRFVCAPKHGSGPRDEGPRLPRKDSGKAAVIPRQLKYVSLGFDNGTYDGSERRILVAEEAVVLVGESRLGCLSAVDFLDHQ